MGPLLIVLGTAAATFAAGRVFTKKVAPGFVDVALPQPNADGSPPAGMRVPPLVNLIVSIPPGVSQLGKTTVTPHGALEPLTWEYMPGHPFEGEGGGGTMPLLWVSPDRKFAAVQWTLDPALGVTFAKPGDVLMANVAPVAVL